MSWITEIPIAHRGLHDMHHSNVSTPENSLKAFEEAIKQEYPIELDVQLLADGELIVFHDVLLERLTNTHGSILEKTFSEICRLRLLGTEQRIPLFSEVLNLVEGSVPLLIEVKNKGEAGKLEDKLWQYLSCYKGEYAIQSFNPHSVAWFKNNAPRVMRGQLSTDFRESDIPLERKIALRDLLFNHISSPDFIAYDIRCLPYEPVTRLRSQGMPVVEWTVCSMSVYQRSRNLCDNIIFEEFLP